MWKFNHESGFPDSLEVHEIGHTWSTFLFFVKLLLLFFHPSFPFNLIGWLVGYILLLIFVSNILFGFFPFCLFICSSLFCFFLNDSQTFFFKKSDDLCNGHLAKTGFWPKDVSSSFLKLLLGIGNRTRNDRQ